MRTTIRTAVVLVFILVCSAFAQAQPSDTLGSVLFLALGDVNLGRAVGQEILKGKKDYPFEKIRDVFKRADIIFANLECPVSDQHGETQSPKSNVIFCAPPGAGATLRRAGVTVVSTANNHAFDYGVKGLQETIKFLHQDSVQFVGTVTEPDGDFPPIIVERKGMRIGIVAYTQTVNIHGRWKGLISVFDSARAQREIAALKPKVDFVLASYHGGDEYKDVPGASAEREMKLLADFGTDVVLGHHPHVPQGIEVYHGCLIFHSLGNAVFHQPQRFWTQRSFAVLMGFQSRNGQKVISSIELIPFRPGYQIEPRLTTEDIQQLMNRIQALSTVPINHSERGYFVESSVLRATQ